MHESLSRLYQLFRFLKEVIGSCLDGVRYNEMLYLTGFLKLLLSTFTVVVKAREAIDYLSFMQVQSILKLFLRCSPPAEALSIYFDNGICPPL